MTRTPRIEQYLDAVTSALEGDDELRLDVRAELASHLDEAATRNRAAGLSPEASDEAALQALGPATDYAGDLVAANRRRMRLRGRARQLLRFLVVPIAVFAALAALLGPMLRFQILGTLGALDAGAFCCNVSPPWLARVEAWFGVSGRRFSPQERLILDGDPTRSNRVLSARAIWEAWPTNVVYFNNYLTTFYSRYQDAGSTPAERMTALNRELERAAALDPENARYAYMRAAKRLDQGATIETVDRGKDEKGGQRTDYHLVVRDRAALDRAMQTLLEGTRKPVLRRYSADMLRERLEILGPPDTLLEQVREIALAAGMLLPDLGVYRNLARASVEYARLLVQEGRPEEARPYLEVWKRMAFQVADDSFTLIDVLVAAAIAKIGQDQAAPVYHHMGDDAAAERTRQAAAAMYAPVAEWRARIKAVSQGEQDDLLKRKAGVLTAMLLPALGESVPDAELAPGRLMDYVLVDQACCGFIALTLIVFMIAALLIALRWRFLRGSGAAPMLLLPDAHETLRIAACGVVLPLAVYAAWTRLMPLGGREYALCMAWPLAATQAAMLATAIVLVTVTLAARAVRARCATLEVTTPAEGTFRRFPWIAAIFGGLVLVIAHVATLWVHGHDAAEMGRGIAAWGLAAFGVTMGIAALVIFIRYLCGASRFGFYRGTVARSLVPHLALAIVLLALLTGPYLRRTEARLVRSDPVMALQTRPVGFTAAEARLTERLRTEMLRAAR